MQHIGPDGQPVLVDPYNPYGEYTGQPHSTGTYGRNGSSSSVGGLPPAGPQPQRFANYEHIAEGADYRTHSPAGYGRTANYADYEPYPHLAGARGGGVGPPPDYAYQTAQPPGLYRDYPDMDPANVGSMAGGVPIYGDRPPTPPSPSEQSESPLPHHSRGMNYFLQSLCRFHLVHQEFISYMYLTSSSSYLVNYYSMMSVVEPTGSSSGPTRLTL